MDTLIEKSKYLGLIAVITLLITFALALLWGVAKAVTAWITILTSFGKSTDITFQLIQLVDAFLLALILYMLAASIYRLFIGRLNVPSRLVANTLPELKIKLSSVIVLVIAVRFVEHLFEEILQPVQVLWLALASALVMGVLVAFGYWSGKQENGSHEEQP